MNHKYHLFILKVACSVLPEQYFTNGPNIVAFTHLCRFVVVCPSVY